jgi:hypothetical protein
MFDLLLDVGGAGIGAYIPNQLSDTIWQNPYNTLADTLGPIGRIAQLAKNRQRSGRHSATSSPDLHGS